MLLLTIYQQPTNQGTLYNCTRARCSSVRNKKNVLVIRRVPEFYMSLIRVNFFMLNAHFCRSFVLEYLSNEAAFHVFQKMSQ